ncbi:MAG: anhydro-N-acetylmuramic acid kinase [Bdellovibrionota bacterium]
MVLDNKLYTTIGLMSGTSKDGIDVACIKTDGISKIEECGAASYDYTITEKRLLNLAEFVVYKADGDLDKANNQFKDRIEEFRTVEGLNQKQLTELFKYLEQRNLKLSLTDIEELSTELHIEAVNKFLVANNQKASEIDLIGYHGQTVFHRPALGITIQLGNAKRFAKTLGVKTVYNFRQADVAAGGEGAPFAPIYHQVKAKLDHLAPCIVLNCGGISNLTAVGKELIAFDSGPGNCLVDKFVQKHFNQNFDLDGKLGLKGKVHDDLLPDLAEKTIKFKGSYLKKLPPKSLDVRDCVIPNEIFDLDPHDACATLEALTAYFISESLQHLPEVPVNWIFAGGGRRNPVITRELNLRLKSKIPALSLQNADEIGWNGDGLEAQIFAFLAVRTIKKLPLSFPGTTGVNTALTGGKIVNTAGELC